MFDCADDVMGYHNDKVTLPDDERQNMHDRRNANRKRLKRGLEKAGRPQPTEFKSQGSYAMRTMTQHEDNKYDIDDGVYFLKEDLVGPRGGEMSALEARQMVRDAVDDGSFNEAPEVKKNCVRVHYDAGYHVDLPVYRLVTTKNIFGQVTQHAELASTDWKRSDARDVTDWFNKENQRQSPDTDNGRQLRRITREIKKYARSRQSWKSQILSGFGITKLVTECYRPNANREDESLHDTMKAIRDRLNWNLVVAHPVTPNETITKGNQDPKAKFFREKLTEAVDNLSRLFEADCTREQALKCWDKVFNTDYFIDRFEKTTSNESGAKSFNVPNVLTAGLLRDAGGTSAAREAVRKEGGGRYA
jgi:hypothetical protein